MEIACDITENLSVNIRYFVIGYEKTVSEIFKGPSEVYYVNEIPWSLSIVGILLGSNT